MQRRLALALILAALTQIGWSVAPAFADDGEDDKESSDDSGDSEDNSDDSSDDGSDDGSGDDSGDDGGGSDDGGQGTSTDGEGEGDHDRARAAVETQAAISLKRLLELFRRDFQGKLVDVTLIKRKSALVYRVKFIEAGGRVRRVDYDATTGTRLN